MLVEMKPIPSTKTGIDARLQRALHMIALCEDGIKMLSGSEPDQFAFTFTMRGKPVVQFEILPTECDLCMSYFMHWLMFFRRERDKLQQLRPS